MLPENKAHVHASHQHMPLLEQYLEGKNIWNFCWQASIFCAFFWLQNVDFPLGNGPPPVYAIVVGLSVKGSYPSH